ncbi:hypothetical protein [Azonexus sp.]|jgi:hypothetical protein
MRALRPLVRFVALPLRVLRRLSLALRYYRHLNYSWHLAWAKSER